MTAFGSEPSRGLVHRNVAALIAAMQVLFCVFLTPAAISAPAEQVAGRAPETAPDPPNLLRTFSGQGIVIDLPKGGRTVIVRHEAIAGLMPKMTMEFAVRDSKELSGLRIGDRITFQVQANADESWIDNIKPSKGEITGPHPVKPLTALAHIAQLKQGDQLPDAELLDENGTRIKFSDFRGKSVAFTFIFTRCPLPDFCPRMNKRFGEAREILLGSAQGPTNWQFISISFDPDNDEPAVLKSYAQIYRGEQSDRWLFASAPTNVLNAIKEQLDFRFINDGSSFAHNLRTVVLDSCGRIYRQFHGNTWQAHELAQAMHEAAKISVDNPQRNTPRTVTGYPPQAQRPHS